MGKDWKCVRCTLVNSAQQVTCRACGAFHPLDDAQSSPGWSCAACTFLNEDMTASTCIICGSERPTPAAEGEGWPCPSCTFSNRLDDPACVICGAPRVTKAPPREKPKPAASSAFQKAAASGGDGDVFIAPLDVETYVHLPQHETPKEAYPMSVRSKKYNRYVDVLPNPVTRVRLRVLDPSDKASDYINANFVRGFGEDASARAYIAAQGPLPTTLESFVRMIWEQNCPIVIMATGLMEQGKRKCEQYWPTDGTVTFGAVSVTMVESKQMFGYVRQKLVLSSQGQKRDLVHFWYNTWPDHGVPKDADGRVDPSNLLTMLRDVRGLRAQFSDAGPILVHCSAGIGRTGVVIAVDQALDAIDRKAPFDLNELIVNDRQDRMCLVQHSSQYKFAHQALLMYAEDTVVRRKTGSVYAFTRGAQRKSIKRDPSWKPVESKQRRTSFLFALSTDMLAPLAEDDDDHDDKNFHENDEPAAATPAAPVQRRLDQQPWFRSGLSRPQVEQVLAGTSAGTFVVRNSARSGYALSIQRGDGYITHMLIVSATGDSGEEMFQLGKLGQRKFDSIEQLLRYYVTRPYGKHTKTKEELFLSEF